LITVLGSTNLDLIGTVSRIPKPGETVPGGAFSMAAGGKGANQALAARRAGAEVRLFAAAGTDSFADEALRLLRADGVDLSRVRTVEGPTGIAMIFVDTAGENVIAILPGANGTVSAADADAALAGLGIGSVLMLQQEIPQAATERALELARAQGVVSILNTAPFLPTTKAVAEQASIVIANETEFELLTGAGLDRLDAAMAPRRRWTASCSRCRPCRSSRSIRWARAIHSAGIWRPGSTPGWSSKRRCAGPQWRRALRASSPGRSRRFPMTGT
jgi:ribokinase